MTPTVVGVIVITASYDPAVAYSNGNGAPMAVADLNGLLLGQADQTGAHGRFSAESAGVEGRVVRIALAGRLNRVAFGHGDLRRAVVRFVVGEGLV